MAKKLISKRKLLKERRAAWTLMIMGPLLFSATWLMGWFKYGFQTLFEQVVLLGAIPLMTVGWVAVITHVIVDTSRRLKSGDFDIE